MRRRLRTAVAALLVPTTLLLAGCGSSVGATARSTGNDLRLGFIVPATGPVSATGLAMQAGFEIAVAEVNDAGGVNGQPITYDVQDDGSDPAASTQIARRYSQDAGVDMLFGTITGDTAAAVTPVAEQAGMAFATAILGDPSDCSAVAFPFGETNRQLLVPQVKALVAAHGPRIAFVGSDYNFPRDYAAAAAEILARNGGQLVAEEYSPLGTADFESTIARLAAARPDAILSMVVGSDAVTFTQQAAAFGLLTPKMGYEGAPLDSDYYPAVAALVTGREHVVRWADGVADPQSRAFVAAYRAKTGSSAPIPEVAANAYFGVKFIAAAVDAAKAGSREEIIKALAAFSLDSPLGRGTRFVTDGKGGRVFQAHMLTATIGAGGYAVARDEGVIDDLRTSCR
ncbi:ABC transporter substrate-binding protein [Pseudonocardia sp. CA-107938]|uniref:ABC transporter substrate-binding protein n=1 Tax=Pseudonocardia sp. CA-107938 TaxID=3240021 RepID=UPI003D8E6548